MSKRFWQSVIRFVPVLLLLLGCGGPSSPAASGSGGGSGVLRLGATPWVPFTAEQGQPRVASYLVERALERAG
ncbi:MAG TPA: hypothetical protein VGK73_24275, partial [Polyangiaceae bacterium]